jgi:hypothetical protein
VFVIRLVFELFLPPGDVCGIFDLRRAIKGTDEAASEETGSTFSFQ